MSQFIRLDLYNKLKCAGGVRIAPIDTNDEQLTQSTDNSDRLTFNAIPGTYAAQYLTVGRVVRAVFRNPADDLEFNILAPSKSSNVNNGLSRIACIPAVQWVLANSGLITQYSATGIPTFSGVHQQKTVTQMLATMITFLADERGIDWLSVGTVEPTALHDYEWTSANPAAYLDGILKLPTVQCEWGWERDGDDGYLLHVARQANIDAPVPVIATAYNLRSHTAATDATQQATVVTPLGAATDGEPATIAEMTLTVDSVDGAELTLSENVVLYDGMWLDKYIVLDAAAFSSVQITASEAPNKLTVSSAAGISAGHRLMMRDTSGESGRDVTRLIAPSSITDEYGHIEKPLPVPSIPGYRNWARNGDLGLWTAGDSSDPDHWVSFQGGGTGTRVITKNTDPEFVMHGQYSMKIALTNPAHFLEEIGAYQNFHVHRRVGRSRFTVVVNLYHGGAGLAAPNYFRMDMLNASGGGLTGGQVSTVNTAPGPELGWHRLALPFDAIVANRNDYRIRIYVAQEDAIGSMSGSTWFFVDSLMVFFGEGAEAAFTANAHANSLRDAGLLRLESHAVPLVQHEVSLLDLGAQNAADRITRGGNLSIRNSALEISDTVRVMQYRRSLRDPGQSAVTVSTRGASLSQTLATL